MNKKIIRIVALILCGVLLLGMVPLLAFAEEIMPRSITREDDVCYFDSFEDLKELAAGSDSGYAEFCYRGEDELVIAENLSIPENAVLSAMTQTVRVAEDVVFFAAEVNCGEFIVDGTAFCAAVYSFERLEINGFLNAGDIRVSFSTELAGLENINAGAAIVCDGWIESMEDLKKMAADAAAQTDHRITYFAFLTISEILESVEMPANVVLMVNDPLTIPAGVTVAATCLVQSDKVSVYGKLDSESVIIDGCPLEIAGEGEADIDYLIVYDQTGAELSDMLPGLDLGIYEIQKYDGAWELIRKSGTLAGDMDGNGVVNDADVAQLLWYTLFPDAYPVEGNADINADGAVNDADVAYLLWYTLFPDSYPIG